jgi:maltose O-acetyltransferase
MESEIEKCLAGQQFNTADQEIQALIHRARRLTREYNITASEDASNRKRILSELLSRVGNNVNIDTPFYCDYGKHISLGNNVIININCTFVDCNMIEIGNNVLISSNVQIYTATHPVEMQERLVEGWVEHEETPYFRTYALPVKIEDNVWIGGGVIILPGTTIGRNSVIGAGSIVTKSVPENSVAFGNPCRVVRSINNK